MITYCLWLRLCYSSGRVEKLGQRLAKPRLFTVWSFTEKKKKFVNPGSVSIVKIFMYFLKEMRSFGEVLSSVVT